jgi:S1-C subfamily serine protease
VRLDKVKIARATVRFPGKGGQGVIVPGGMIVTAAHVVNWDVTGQMAQLWDSLYWEDVEIGGRSVKAQVYAVEPVADVAVLGAPDDQAHADVAEAFEACLESIKPVPICTKDFPLGEPFAVYIRAHTGDWIKGQAVQRGVNAQYLGITPEGDIKGGTSGSPVVTAQGLLVGVISRAGGAVGEPTSFSVVPRLHLTAPGWLIRRMRDPQWEIRATRRAIAAIDVRKSTREGRP